MDSEKEDSNDRKSILLAINKKINGWKRTRRNRINASERLKKYSEKWSFSTFILNVEAVFFTIFSLGSHNVTNGEDVFVGAFSVYVILLQYFLATLNYEARAQKFHYEQLKIQDLRQNLKTLYHSRKSVKNLENQFNGIVREYQENLFGYENHLEIDDQRTQAPEAKIKDFSIENIFIYLNYLICVVSVIGFLLIVFI